MTRQFQPEPLKQCGVSLEHGAALTILHTGMLAGSPGDNYPLAPTYPGSR